MFRGKDSERYEDVRTRTSKPGPTLSGKILLESILTHPTWVIGQCPCFSEFACQHHDIQSMLVPAWHNLYHYLTHILAIIRYVYVYIYMCVCMYVFICIYIHIRTVAGPAG